MCWPFAYNVHTCNVWLVHMQTRARAHLSQAVLLSIVPASPLPHLTRLSPDQEPDQEVDDFAVAQSTPLPECIAGCEGDTVRRPSFTADLPSAPLCFPCPLRSHRFCKRTPFLVPVSYTHLRAHET